MWGVWNAPLWMWLAVLLWWCLLSAGVPALATPGPRGRYVSGNLGAGPGSPGQCRETDRMGRGASGKRKELACRFFESYSSAFSTFVLGNAPVKQIVTGFDWVEGPVWLGRCQLPAVFRHSQQPDHAMDSESWRQRVPRTIELRQRQYPRSRGPAHYVASTARGASRAPSTMVRSLLSPTVSRAIASTHPMISS